MRKSDSLITLTLAQFFQNDDAGLGWIAAREQTDQAKTVPSSIMGPEAEPDL